MINFFHKLLNPHCPHCMESERENRVCASCEVLKLENARLVRLNNELLHKLLNPTTSIENEVEEPKELKPVYHTRFGSWRVKQQLLQDNDRKNAQILKERQKEIDALKAETKTLNVEEIERELGVSDAVR